MAQNEEYLEIEDVVKIFKIARNTIYDKTNPKKTQSEHLMPCYKPTGKLLFKRSEIEKWIERHRIKAS